VYFRVETQEFRSILGRMQTTAYTELRIALDFFSKSWVKPNIQYIVK